MYRGGGRSLKLRRHGGYRPRGLVWPCGSQQRRRRPAPCWGRVREGVAPPAMRVGVIPGKILILQMRNTAFWCIFSSVSVMYAHGWNPCALWLLRVRRELLPKIGACGWLDWSLRSWTFLCLKYHRMYTLYTAITLIQLLSLTNTKCSNWIAKNGLVLRFENYRKWLEWEFDSLIRQRN